MARALFWEHATPGNKLDHVPADEANDSLKKLIETFGRDPVHPLSPVELTKDKVFTLRQMGARGSVFGRIADLIETHGKLRVWGRD